MSWTGDDVSSSPNTGVIDSKFVLKEESQPETEPDRNTIFRKVKDGSSWMMEDDVDDNGKNGSSQTCLKVDSASAAPVATEIVKSERHQHNAVPSMLLSSADPVRHPSDDHRTSVVAGGGFHGQPSEDTANNGGAPPDGDGWRPATDDWSWEGSALEDEDETAQTDDGWRNRLSRSAGECRRLTDELDDMRRQKRAHDGLVRRLTAQLASVQHRMRQTGDREVGRPTDAENPDGVHAEARTATSSSLSEFVMLDEDEENGGSEATTPGQHTEIRRLQSEVTSLIVACEDLERQKVSLTEELHRSRDAGAGETEAPSNGGGQGLDSANQTDDNKELETMQARLLVLESEVSELTAERDGLETSLEELDSQHQLAIDQVLTSRDELQVRFRSLTAEREQVESLLRAEVLAETEHRQNAEKRLEQSSALNERLKTEVESHEKVAVDLTREIDELWLSFASEAGSTDAGSATGPSDVCKSIRAATQKLFFRVEELEENSEHFRLEVRRLQRCYDEQDAAVVELRRERAVLDSQLHAARERARTTIEEDVLGEELESLRARVQLLEGELARERMSRPQTDQGVDDENLGSSAVRVIVEEPRDNILADQECQTEQVIVDTRDLSVQTVKEPEPCYEEREFQTDIIGTLASTREMCVQTAVETLQRSESIDSWTQVEKEEVEEEDQQESPKRDAKDQQTAAVLYAHVRELQAMTTSLEGQLRERDSHVSSLESILRVYKENLEPDIRGAEETARTQQLETERRHQGQLGELRSERDQIMSVLDSKARENSSLKAEVHRLMSVVSAERAALAKMQRDVGAGGGGEAQRKSSEISEDERNAAHNHVRLSRDKEIEIEALRQRNQTLVALLQEGDSRTSTDAGATGGAPPSATVQELMTEREQLGARLEQSRVEREQMVAVLNQKHGESVAYHAEIQRLLEVVRGESTRAALLEQQHAAVARQYEDGQRALLEIRNDELALRRRLGDTEQARDSLQAKYNRLLQEEENHVRKDISLDAVEKECAEEDKELLGVHVDREEWSAKLKELEQLQRQAQDRDKMLYEKDCLMHEKMRAVESTRELLARRDEEMVAVRLHLEHAGRELAASREDAEGARQQNAALRMRTEDLRSEIAVLKESNSSLSITLQEREFESKALREKVRTLSLWIEQHAVPSTTASTSPTATTAAAAATEGSADGERTLKRLLAESEEMRQRAQGFQAERDQALLALGQRQREIEALHQQIRGPLEREERLLKELERLRQHLVHVEESYTQEALRAEDREKELRVRLALAEDRLRMATSSRSAESQHASLQVESLQEQLRVIMEQRDSALQKLSVNEDQLAKREAAFRTLQVVLEQLQQERRRDMSTVQVQHNSKLLEEQRHSQKLSQEVKRLELRIEEAGEALEAASRLSEQLDRKEEVMRALREEVESREAALQKANMEIDRLANNSEVTVDRSIVKNLVVGYITIPLGTQKKEVLRIIATVLDFNKDEREKTGLDEIKIGWIGWLSGRSPNSSPGRRQNAGVNQQSLSEAFVRFLESESKPRQQIQFPLDSLMTPTKGSSNRQQQQPSPTQSASSTSSRGNGNGGTTVNPVVNPFAFSLIPRPDASGNLLLGGGGGPAVRDNHSPLGSSHLLMKPMSTALPTFTPMPVADGGFSANNVLRDVLKSDQ